MRESKPMAFKKCKIEIDGGTVCCATHGWHYREFVVGLDAIQLSNKLLDRYNDHRSQRTAQDAE